MVEVKQTQRLSPPLMFVFRDAHRARDAKVAVDQRDKGGQRVVAARKSLRASISEPQLRGELARDLDALLNTTNLAAAEDLERQEMVRQSIVNYGVPDIVRITIDENRVGSISEGLAAAIETFEPRVIRRTLRVERDRSVDESTLSIRFRVVGDMACNPVAVPVEFLADLEVSSGKLALKRR